MSHPQVTTARALVTSFTVNIIDITTNVVVAIITGSAVMLAEAMQGFADLTAVTLLLIGHKRARKTATAAHPFGFGKEAYFWALLAAVVMLLITATLSFYSGLQSVINPHPVESVFLAYAILGLAVVTNGYTFSVGARRLLEGKKLSALPSVVRRTVHIAPRTSIVLDGLGFLAAVFGSIALTIYGITGDPRFDGIGAMIIGVIMAIAAITLLLSLKAFITGKRASAETERLIKNAALNVPGVVAVLDLRTMVLGSENILINLELHFADDMVTDQLEAAVDNVKKAVGRAVKMRTYIQVELETPPRPRKSQ